MGKLNPTKPISDPEITRLHGLSIPARRTLRVATVCTPKAISGLGRLVRHFIGAGLLHLDLSISISLPFQSSISPRLLLGFVGDA